MQLTTIQNFESRYASGSSSIMFPFFVFWIKFIIFAYTLFFSLFSFLIFEILSPLFFFFFTVLYPTYRYGPPKESEPRLQGRRCPVLTMRKVTLVLYAFEKALDALAIFLTPFSSTGYFSNIHRSIKNKYQIAKLPFPSALLIPCFSDPSKPAIFGSKQSHSHSKNLSQIISFCLIDHQKCLSFPAASSVGKGQTSSTHSLQTYGIHSMTSPSPLNLSQPRAPTLRMRPRL